MIEPWRPCAVALQRVDVARGATALRDDRCDPRPVLGVKCDVHDPGIGKGVRLIAGADDDGRDLRLLEHPGAGDGGDIDPMAIADCLQGLKQLLEKIPATKVVDDQLVFDQRPVFERHFRLRDAEPSVAEKAAGHRAVAEEADAVFRGECRKAVAPAAGRARSIAVAG